MSYEAYDEKMQNHLDDAHKIINDQYDEWYKTKSPISLVFNTTDGGKFIYKNEAIKHQYKIERGII